MRIMVSASSEPTSSRMHKKQRPRFTSPVQRQPKYCLPMVANCGAPNGDFQPAKTALRTGRKGRVFSVPRALYVIGAKNPLSASHFSTGKNRLSLGLAETEKLRAEGAPSALPAKFPSLSETRAG